jgi:hypothetical protein
MNATQRRIVVFTLYALSAFLVLVFWRVGTQHDYNRSLLIWHLRETIGGSYGLRLRVGVAGVVLGLIAPVLLAGAATFILSADRK